MISLAFLGFTLLPLFTDDTPSQERVEALRGYFTPKIGDMVEAEAFDLRDRREEPLRIRGYIRVEPPKGHCFIIRRRIDQPDLNVCQAMDVSFEMADLQENGSIQWHIIQGPTDEGTPVSWPSPYRLIRLIKLGQFASGHNIRIPIKKCEAETNEFHRKITLSLMNDERWVILLPDKDRPLKSGNYQPPNLYMRSVTGSASEGIMGVMSGMTGGGAESSSENKPSSRRSQDREHSGRGGSSAEASYRFNLGPRGSFEMDSSRVMRANTPIGMKGSCRYRLSGAPDDPESGAIECFNTEGFDAIYTHLTCTDQLPALD